MNIPKAISMIDYRSRSTQKLYFLAYIAASLALFLWWICGEGKKEKIINFFNFMADVDPSGFLIFAGVASGIAFKLKGLFYYRNFAFFFGFLFAIAQAAVAAMGEMEASQETVWQEALLIATMWVCGSGFIVFSLLAMAAYEKDDQSDSVPKEKLLKHEEAINSSEIILNLSVKNGSVQPSPAPSDLAHDLRYSRSRARRSRAQR